MKVLVFVFLINYIAACTTESEYVPKKIDTQMEELGKTEDGKYGLNKEGELIIQNEKDPAYELMIAKRVNESLFLELERDAYALDVCVQEFSDPALRGSGKFKRVDDYENLRPKYASKEEMGVDEDGKLKMVEKSFFEAQVKDANKQMEILKKTLRYTQTELRKCETELMYAKKALKNRSDELD